MIGTKKRVFLCYHYENEHVLASKIEQEFLLNNHFVLNGVETEKMCLESNIKKWIDSSLENNDIVLLILGEHTLKRKWVLYELKVAFEKGQTVIGICSSKRIVKKVKVLNHFVDILTLQSIDSLPYQLEKRIFEGKMD